MKQKLHQNHIKRAACDGRAVYHLASKWKGGVAWRLGGSLAAWRACRRLMALDGLAGRKRRQCAGREPPSSGGFRRGADRAQPPGPFGGSDADAPGTRQLAAGQRLEEVETLSVVDAELGQDLPLFRRLGRLH